MDMEIVGRHALFFDDDAMAAFVNSDDALVQWHSLKIDRYDVRHLLSDPPPPRRRNRSYEPRASDDPSVDFLIEQERYLDLPLGTVQPELEEEEKPSSNGGYRSVAFSYGNTDDSTEQKNTDVEMEASGYRPPFSVPEDIVQSLPPTEKVHQIIARTATFVSKHGGQSEIILRVKQGDNPTFGFLMPDHHLHAYFRYLIEHPELVHAGIDEKSQDETKTAGSEHQGSAGGALSLLGSVYGSGEDEDGDDAVNASPSNDSKNVESVIPAMKDESASRKPILSKKDKLPAVKKNSSILGSRSKRIKKEDNSGLFSSIEGKLKNHGIGATSIQIPEPPPEMKRMIDKLVEFVMRNGKQFEATILEQDSKLERFPFLIPSNQYHPYYLKALQAAQESKVNGKGFYPGQEDQSGHGIGKRAWDISCSTSEFGDVPFESDRKEKFKMVLGKSKKEAQETEKESQESGFTVDAAAAAAILQAAAKGIKSTGLHIIRSTAANSHGAAGGADSTDNLTEEQKLKAVRLKKAKMFVAMLKSGALPSRTGTSRGSSAEPVELGMLKSVREVNRASQERESSLAPDVVDKPAAQSNFYERLSEQRSKRKYRSRSTGSEDDEEDSHREGHSRLRSHKEDGEVGNPVEKDRKHHRRRRRSHSSSEESENGEESDKHDAKLKHHKSKHRSRHSHHDDDDREGTYKEERDKEHRKSRSRRSSESKSRRYEDKNGARDKLEKEDRHSKRKHSSHSSYEDNGGESSGDDKDAGSKDIHKEEKDHKRSRKKHRSSHSSHHSKHKHKHRSSHSSKDEESHHRHKHDSSSDDEHHHHRANSDQPEKQLQDVRTEMEEGEIGLKVSPDESNGTTGGDGKRGSSFDVMSVQQRASSQPSETTEVPADLRAKIRAMLMAARS